MAVTRNSKDFLQQNHENNDFRLEGSYSNHKQGFDWFSFENDGLGTFRYYYISDDGQKEDRGTFEKISDQKYILSSPYLGDVEVTCFKNFPNTTGFTLASCKTKCDYIQTSTMPTQLEVSP